MRKQCLLFVLVFFLFLPGLHGIGRTETYIYALSHYGIETGRWGVEINKQGTIKYINTMDRFQEDIRSLVLLTNLAGEKKVTLERVIISNKQRQSMTFLEIGRLKWQINIEPDEILVKRFDTGKIVDELGIHPILPVYDLTSFLFSFQDNNYETDFDFYLIEPRHEKRLQVNRRSPNEWIVRHDTVSLVRITLDDAGIPETIDFGASDIQAVRGYRLSLICSRLSPRKATRFVSPRDALEAFSTKHKGIEPAYNCTGRFEPEGRQFKGVYNNNCLRIYKDVTSLTKKLVVDKMKSNRILKDKFKRKSLTVSIRQNQTDREPKYYPAISSDISRKIFKLDKIRQELKQSIRREARTERIFQLGIKVERETYNDKSITIPYSYNGHKKIDNVHKIDLIKEFTNRIQNGQLVDKCKIAGEQGKTITIGGYEGHWYGDKYIGEISFDLDEHRENLKKADSKIVNAKFDTSEVEKNRKLNIKYTTEISFSKRDVKTINYLDYFEKNYGILKNYIKASVHKSGNSIDVTYELNSNLLNNCSVAEYDLLDKILPNEVVNTSITLQHNEGKSIVEGSGGLSLSYIKILDMLGIPHDAKIVMNGDRLNFTYNDFSCPQ